MLVLALMPGCCLVISLLLSSDTTGRGGLVVTRWTAGLVQ